jgi:SCY1-like protein 1
MGNSASSLPYSIGSKVEESEGWTVSEGSKKSDGSAVTVFTANKASLVPKNVLEPARHHFESCKKLRHPMLLKVEATLDTDHTNSNTDVSNNATVASSSTNGDWIVVAEPCVSLQQ